MNLRIEDYVLIAIEQDYHQAQHILLFLNKQFDGGTVLKISQVKSALQRLQKRMKIVFIGKWILR